MKNAAIDTKSDKEPIVDLNDVWVAYDGKWILKSIYFNCYPGEIFGIVGPNGGGKTTMLNIIIDIYNHQKVSFR